MSTYFSEKFKQLRKNRNLTQEQISDIFHVSFQTISRWETGVNYPDVEMLPHIAIFFKVSLDELLGIDMIAKEERVEEYLRDIKKMHTSGKIDEAIKMGRQAIKENPTNTVLQALFITVLSSACFQYIDDHSEKATEYKKEMITIGTSFINSVDYKTSLHARTLLIKLYSGWGMREEAKKLINTLPENMYQTQESWLDFVTEGKEKEENQKRCIHMAKEILIRSIKRFSDDSDLSVMQKIEYYEASTQIRNLTAKIISDDTKNRGLIYPLEQLKSTFENIELAELYCETEDSGTTLDCVEKAMNNSLNFIEFMSNPNEFDHDWHTTRNLPWVLWEDHLIKPCFDFVRNNERFKTYLETLKLNSHEL